MVYGPHFIFEVEVIDLRIKNCQKPLGDAYHHGIDVLCWIGDLHSPNWTSGSRNGLFSQGLYRCQLVFDAPLWKGSGEKLIKALLSTVGNIDWGRGEEAEEFVIL